MSAPVYVFPGQGSQKVGMGQALCGSSPEVRALFDRADEQLGYALSRLCFEGPAEELTDTCNAQPALLVASLAQLAVARAAGAPAPGFVAGHSLGHFTTLAAAGSLTFEAALLLVRERGLAMKQAGEQSRGSMAAVMKLDAGQLSEICAQASRETGSYVGIANDDAPGQIVISGAIEALERAGQLCKEAGAKRVLPLSVSGAFHSPLVAGAADRMAELLADIDVRPPACPVMSNVTGQPLGGPAEIRADIVQQITSPVRWADLITNLAAAGASTFVEIGPGSVLAGLIGRILPAATVWSLDDADGLARLVALAD